jgi:hypothetical protein
MSRTPLYKHGHNYFGNGENGSVVTSTNYSLGSANFDNGYFVGRYSSFTLGSSNTFGQGGRCKGLIILVNGNFTNNGTISSITNGLNENRGAAVAADTSNKYVYFPANTGKSSIIVPTVGASGAPATNTTTSTSGLPGSAGSSGQMGGGGAGGCLGTTAGNGTGGAGAAGTEYSGGPGGGGGGPGSIPSNIGGAGNAGAANGGMGGSGGTSSTGGSGAGAGNPPGVIGGSGSGSGFTGTGQLILIVVNGNFVNNSGAIIQAWGSAGITGNASGKGILNSGGGGAGAGSIIIAYTGTFTNNGTIQCQGGASAGPSPGGGGAGGVGSIQHFQIRI